MIIIYKIMVREEIGQSTGFIQIIAIVAAVAFVSLSCGCCSCREATDFLVSRGGDAYGNNAGADADRLPNPGESCDISACIREADLVRDGAAAALMSGDEGQFLAWLTDGTKRSVQGSLDLSGPGAGEVAGVLKQASVKEANPDIVFYEAIVDGETVSFYVIRDDSGEWRLAGF
jgi:hypothetical protein